MKCKDCDCAKKGFFSYQPEEYVCIGVKEPFVIGDINSECTEYESKRNMKMTREEAIKKCKEDVFFGSQELLDMVIATMEKQIPKKPKMEEDDFDYGTAYVCQVCGTFIAYETDILSGYCKVNYCTECGNAILWGEEND